MSSDVLRLIGIVLEIFAWMIIARSLMSWFPNARGNPIVDALFAVTDPILLPLQKVIPRIGMIDISPMIATLVLFAVARTLQSAAI